MSAYEELPGHHLFAIHNLIVSSPDDSYPETAGSIADDINFFMDNFTAEEAVDYSGVRDPDTFRSFQLAVAYCLTCSEDSSNGDYDPTRECFVVELANGGVKRRREPQGAPTCEPGGGTPTSEPGGSAPSEPRRFVKLGVMTGAAGATHGAREKA